VLIFDPYLILLCRITKVYRMASNSAKPQSVKVGVALKKIDSPLARYNNAGQLTCVVCNVVVKSEKVWTAHVSGRQHREQIEALKKPKASDNFAKPLAVSAIKRKADSEASESYVVASPSPSKKGVPSDFFDNKISSNNTPKPIKSILKNSSRPPIQPKVVSHEIAGDEQMDVDEMQHITAQVSYNSSKVINEGNVSVKNQTNPIPEGFFDDPKMDAKVFFFITINYISLLFLRLIF
jgi:zinc finger protein 830